MSEENKLAGNGKNDKKNGEVKVPPRNWLIWILILGAIPIVMILKNRTEAKFAPLTRNELVTLVDKKEVLGGLIHYNPQSSLLQEVTGRYVKTDAKGNPVLDTTTGKPTEVAFRVKTRLNDSLEKTLLD